MRRGLALLAATAAALTAAAGARAGSVEVVVGLVAPGLAQAHAESRTLTVANRRTRLDVRAPASLAYLRQLDSAQRALAARITARVPGAQVRWRYRIVADGLAVVVAPSYLRRLGRVPGVARIYPSVTYHSLLDRSPQLIGAPFLWGPTFATAGNGMKIGIVDDGLDQSHPFFAPSGFTPPAGFPKGQTAFTTAKVIAARAFVPPTPAWKNADKPFDPEFSEHATHVAGIAAGDHGVIATGGLTVSGIAPNAYLGNYKVLTIPTPGFGLDGNAPEIAAGIEAAVRDGMDVINLSLGEPEIAPSRDLVVQAIEGAAAAGVVPAIAAGNDFSEFGRGSIGSPGSAPSAITAAAASAGRDVPADVIASFSSGGPTPVSLGFKPDVTAPGLNILSSVPARKGLWAVFSGTSMASPHVAGAAALLKERHPTWTVAQIKSALALTGDPVYADAARTQEVSAAREGGGRIDLPRANDPLIFAAPTGVSYGLVKRGEKVARTIQLTDAGGGAGAWSVTVAPQTPGVAVSSPQTVTVPGPLDATVAAGATAAEGEVTGFIVLTRAGQTRRIPFWMRIDVPRLGSDPRKTLARAGVYRGNTARGRAGVSTYRYPELRPGLKIPIDLGGPEVVYRVHLASTIANFGAVVLAHAAGTSVEPRIVSADDENRLAGYTALPFDLNPYRQSYGKIVPAVAVDRPEKGDYDIVFDSTSRARAGAFTFRLWLNDETPPAVRLLGASGGRARLSITDRGSGVDPSSIIATVDGKPRTPSYSARTGIAVVELGPGRHELAVSAADWQETKNMENVSRITPNTRVFRATVGG